MRIADLFCGAGGAGMGLHRAGFEVIGFDIEPQKNYPFEFHQQDALTVDLREFDAVWASPPCQLFTIGLNNTQLSDRDKHLDFITPIREIIVDSGLPYIIENVVSAPLQHWIMLCGTMFGLKVIRHRWFESTILLWSFGHSKHNGVLHNGDYIAVYNGKWRNSNSQYPIPKRFLTKSAWAHAMKIDWMTKQELSQAIPPDFSQHLGRQLFNHIELTT